MSEAPILEAEGVVCGYGERRVLQGVSLSLYPGDFVGIIGPNGSGKSTLIKALTGILPLRGGAVRVAGKDISAYDPRALARVMAVVPQVSVPAFAFTVREMVEMGRHPHHHGLGGLSAADAAAVDEAIELTDIAHLQRRTVEQLSTGELQRVIIARALAQRPRVLLLDEPTAHLDIGHQLEIFRLLARLDREQGLAVLCISHDLNLAAEYCARLLLFSVGRVFAEGTAAEVVTEAHLRAVYGTVVRVDVNQYSGQPLVLHSYAPQPDEEEEP